MAIFRRRTGGNKMARSKTMRGALALALLMGGMATASAQGILDRMKEDAQRRAENKAVMDAENPAPAKKAEEAAAPAAPAPAQSASATPATPATPAPAPAQ
jgi:hypothetical protein